MVAQHTPVQLHAVSDALRHSRALGGVQRLAADSDIVVTCGQDDVRVWRLVSRRPAGRGSSRGGAAGVGSSDRGNKQGGAVCEMGSGSMLELVTLFKPTDMLTGRWTHSTRDASSGAHSEGWEWRVKAYDLSGGRGRGAPTW